MAKLTLDQLITKLRHLPEMAQGVQAEQLKKIGSLYRDELIKATPRGESRGGGSQALYKSYRTDFTTSGNTSTYRITNRVKHLRYVLHGRGPVVAKRGKALRFVIGGKVFFRKRVKGVLPNRFDQRVRNQFAPRLRELGIDMRDVVVDKYRGEA